MKVKINNLTKDFVGIKINNEYTILPSTHSYVFNEKIKIILCKNMVKTIKGGYYDIMYNTNGKTLVHPNLFWFFINIFIKIFKR